MINNRQGGRRRGRGGQRPPNVGGRPDGNRQDNRQRGNAAQLLEKYKSMARDSQLAGDRVQTEYYLQFADHYYRVLGESRARFEEQRRQRGDDLDEDEGDEDMEAGDERLQDGGQDYDRSDRSDRSDGQERQERGDRPERSERERPERFERPERAARPDRPDRGERNRRPQRDDRNGEDVSERFGAETTRGSGESIAFEALPPAIGRDSGADGVVVVDEEAPSPRRRTRRPRAAEGDSDTAPAA